MLPGSFGTESRGSVATVAVNSGGGAAVEEWWCWRAIFGTEGGLGLWPGYPGLQRVTEASHQQKDRKKKTPISQRLQHRPRSMLFSLRFH